MSRPTVTVISAKGESSKDTLTVPNVFKVSSTPLFAIRGWSKFRRDETDANNALPAQAGAQWRMDSTATLRGQLLDKN
jgi:large subunit ribosomal protein L4e